MRTYFTLITFCYFSLIGFGQELQLEKASPFTAVKWENDQPIVQYANDWYTLGKLDIYSTQKLLDFCKEHYESKWQKRFSEDLVEVLRAMGSPPNEKVSLLLSKGAEQKTVIGTYTLENRQQVLKYNRKHTSKSKRPKSITISQALEDIDEFQQILEQRSSYIHLINYDYKEAITSLKNSLDASKNEVDINYLSYELAKIMAEIGDRHSSVKNELFDKYEHSSYTLQLPFSIAPLNGKVAALEPAKKEGTYDYLYTDFPFVKSINKIAIDVLMDSLAYKAKKAPKEARFGSGLSEIQQLGTLYFSNNLALPKQIEIVYTNGSTDKTEFVQLQNKNFRYYSIVEQNSDMHSEAIKKGNFKSIAKVLDGTIGYIAVPEMYDFDKIEGLERFMDSTLSAFRNTAALIIDLRFNPGGVRDLIQKFADYSIPKPNSPWVANVAYLRTDEPNVPHTSMASRYLHVLSSDKFNELDKKSIAEFSENHSTQILFDRSKFSNPHYMVLESGKEPYSKPIYMLVNEQSFSAAAVFASAFKGLPNVKIVGVTTDGSSGNSKIMHLEHSNIRVRISTMLSFQRNGKTLDGHGTKPDIHIPENEDQVLRGKDAQLEKLLKIISNQ